jgi:hypothetical protein
VTSLLYLITRLPVQTFLACTLLPIFGLGMAWCRELARRIGN